MRPLTVLILILGALAALTFAILSLTGNDVRGEGSGRGNVVGPVTPGASPTTAKTPANLSNPDRVVPPAATLGSTGTDERQAVPTADGGGTWANVLTGVVRSPDGIPVEGAEVALYRGRSNPALRAFQQMVKGGIPDKPVRVQTTGRQGLFQFLALQPGDNWLISVAHADYAYKEVGPILVPEEGTAQEDVELAQGFSIAGHVRDSSSGQPLPGAVVKLDDQLSINMPGDVRGPHYQETTANADGSYAFKHVSPQTYSLVCAHPGFGTTLKTNVAVMGENEKISVDFDMEVGQVLAGRVVDGLGKGVEGAVIEAISHNMAKDRGVSRGNTVSAKDGEFLIDDVLSGQYTMSVKADGFQSEPAHRIEAGNTNIVLRVTRQGSVMGRVVDASTGRAIPDFQVKVRQVNPAVQAATSRGRVVSQTKVTGSSDGAFELSGISQGTYVVQGVVRGYANSFSGRFVVNEGQATPDVEVRMSKGGKLTGTVVDARTREPLAGVLVSTHDNNWIDSEFTNLLGGLNDPHVAHQKVKTGADGSFEIPLLTAEAYQIRIASGEHTLVTMNDIEVLDGETRDLGVTMLSKGATVTGTVFGPDGSVAKGVTVYLQPTDGSYSANQQARTDAAGQYQLKNAWPGTYKLSASRPADQGNPFQTIIDMKQSEVELILMEGGEVNHSLYIGGE